MEKGQLTSEVASNVIAKNMNQRKTRVKRPEDCFMDFDEVDPTWIEACIAVVDNIPAANLTETPHLTFKSQERVTAVSGGRSTRVQRDDGDEITACHRIAVCHGDEQGSSRVAIRGIAVKSNSPRDRRRTKDDQYRRNGGADAQELRRGVPALETRVAERSGVSTYGRGNHRVHGVGINPDDIDATSPMENFKLDPCWRCGSAVIPRDYGGNKIFGCSSYPFCKATRRTSHNGVVVELFAREVKTEAEKSPGASIASSTPSKSEDASASRILGSDHESHGRAGCYDLTRCHLIVRVRGSDHAGATPGTRQAAILTLMKHGMWSTVLPRGEPKEAQNGPGGRKDVCRISAEVESTLPLNRRDEVVRVMMKERLALRDLPPSTYRRLMDCGAGVVAARRASNVTNRNADRRREGYATCDALMHKLPACLRETLLPFQREGVMFGLRRKGRCLIADEMGTGKTLQALGVMGCYKEDWPLLIVSPASMRLMWAEEVERWYPFLAPDDIHLIRGSKDKLYLSNCSRWLWPRVVIVSYFMLGRLAGNIGQEEWKAVIFDESHMISTKLGDESSEAKQTRVCVEVAKRATRVVMLSGTPSMSKPFDLYNQVEALSPGLLGGGLPLRKAKQSFAANYCGGIVKQQTSKGGNINRVPYVSGSEHADELHLLLKNEVMIRRLKADVVRELPPLRRVVVRVAEDTEALKAALDAGGFATDLEGEDDELAPEAAGAASGPWVGGMSDVQRAGLKKVKSASQWVVDKLAASRETRTKLVVFAHHRVVLDRLQEEFELAGGKSPRADEEDKGDETTFSCLRIDGEVPTAARASRLAQFNREECCRVLVVSITAGGQGLDFTAASNVVFVELPESPAWFRQAEDRLHRRRQKESVNVYIMVLSAGSHDDTRWCRLSRKLATQTSVINGIDKAEKIEIDRICEADDFRAGAGRSWLAARGQRRRRYTDATQDLAFGGSEESSDDGAGDVGDNSKSSLDSMTRGGKGRDGSNAEAVDETELDREIREALVSTPLDVAPNVSSQSPTLRLLVEIANRSPASDERSSCTNTRASSGTGLVARSLSAPRKSPPGSSQQMRHATATLSSSLSPSAGRKRGRHSMGVEVSPRGSNPRPFPFRGPPGLASATVTDRARSPLSRAGTGDDQSERESPVLEARDGPTSQDHAKSSQGERECNRFYSPGAFLDLSVSDEEQKSDVGPADDRPWQRSSGANGVPQAPGAGDERARDLLFLVSPHTGRVHVYMEKKDPGCVGGTEGIDGFEEEASRPRQCRCNFRAEDLDRLFALATAASTVRSSQDASLDDEHEVAAKEMLRALPELMRHAQALKVAREFLMEWRALPSRKRALLGKTPCRPPLATIVDDLTCKLTGSTVRYRKGLPTETAGKADGTTASGVRNASGQVLCLYCTERPASCQGPAVDKRDRFCSTACMEALSARSSSKGLRRQVFARDHGVCCSEVGCGRDCLALVSRLKAVRDPQARRQILVAEDVRFAGDCGRNLRERLVWDPVEGNAWEADHVTAVYQGGGECGVDNMRTLCVLCHTEISRKQTSERAQSRRLAKEEERRAREEAEGQRRLVSIGGGITLSRPSRTPQRHSKGGTGSPEDALVLDTDDEDDGALQRGSNKDDAAGTAASSSNEMLRMSWACKDFGEGRSDPCMKLGATGRAVGGVCSVTSTASTKEGTRPCLAAFERLVRGQDFDVHDLNADVRPYRSAPKNSDEGVGESRREHQNAATEIKFTRVRHRPKLIHAARASARQASREDVPRTRRQRRSRSLSSSTSCSDDDCGDKRART